jgi:hypothetical protein
MISMRKRLGLVATGALFIGAAACSNKSPATDESLAAALKAAGGTGSGVELAPRGNPSQMVVSAIEGGPQSAPHKAAPQRVNKPTPRADTRVAAAPEATPEPSPAPAPVAPQPVQQQAQQPAPVQPAPAPVNRPQPVQAQQAQHGPYKTEAEIFRQMPWIRP